jgi:hypothetical protein
MNSYYSYVSLGENCETAFQIRRYLGYDLSSFFSWNITFLPSLIRILDDGFNHLIKFDNLSWKVGDSLVYDNSYDYFFHPLFSTQEEKSKFTQWDLYEKQISKSKYFIDKFLSQANSGERLIYFYKSSKHTGIDAMNFSLKIYNSLLKLHKIDNFKLIIIQDKIFFEEPWPLNNIHNLYVDYLAHFSSANCGDDRGWDLIFSKFPLEKTLL